MTTPTEGAKRQRRSAVSERFASLSFAFHFAVAGRFISATSHTRHREELLVFLARRTADPEVALDFERLEAARASEDPTVAYDSMRFLDFDRLDHPSGTVRFTKGNERLTVINVNRQPLERTTGADLIYINETCASFVLVQYKSFRNEKPDGTSRLVYRPDAQLAAELERMRKIKPGKRDGRLGTYRLHRGCCFLKICKPVVRVDHPADELVSGMYLPLDYYDELVVSDDVKGPRDGVALSYGTVDRYLNNDLFVQLVRGAWIGSRGATTKRLTDIALAGPSGDRSVTIAAASIQTPSV